MGDDEPHIGLILGERVQVRVVRSIGAGGIGVIHGHLHRMSVPRR